MIIYTLNNISTLILSMAKILVLVHDHIMVELIRFNKNKVNYIWIKFDHDLLNSYNYFDPIIYLSNYVMYSIYNRFIVHLNIYRTGKIQDYKPNNPTCFRSYPCFK